MTNSCSVLRQREHKCSKLRDAIATMPTTENQPITLCQGSKTAAIASAGFRFSRLWFPKSTRPKFNGFKNDADRSCLMMKSAEMAFSRLPSLRKEQPITVTLLPPGELANIWSTFLKGHYLLTISTDDTVVGEQLSHKQFAEFNSERIPQQWGRIDQGSCRQNHTHSLPSLTPRALDHAIDAPAHTFGRQ